jgi:hypothetical protein
MSGSREDTYLGAHIVETLPVHVHLSKEKEFLHALARSSPKKMGKNVLSNIRRARPRLPLSFDLDLTALSVAAVPQIVFLATFLLLLSFWIDLCHQTSDLSEEEEDEAEAEAEGQPGAPESSSGCSKPFSRRRWRLWWKKLRPRGRKAVFVGVRSSCITQRVEGNRVEVAHH